MVPAGNKAKRLSSVNHTTETNHHHHQGIKSIINISKKSNKTINYIKLNDQEVTNPFEVARPFNQFFCTVGQKIEDKIIHTDTKYQDFLDNPASQTFFSSPTDPEEIELLIKSLSSNKTTGPASIPTNILKMFKKELKTPLSNLLNLSFECGAFPEILKATSVTPIFKKR